MAKSKETIAIFIFILFLKRKKKNYFKAKSITASRDVKHESITEYNFG